MEKISVNGIEYERFTESETRALSTISMALSKIYYIYYDVNLKDDSFLKIHASSFVSQLSDNYTSAHECLQAIAKTRFAPEQQATVAGFYDTYKWPEMLKNYETLYYDALGSSVGWVRTNLIVAARDENGVPTHVAFAIQNVDHVKTKELAQTQQLKDQLEEITDLNRQLDTATDKLMKAFGIADALTYNYNNVYLVDRRNRTAEVMKSSDLVAKGTSADLHQCYPYDLLVQKYVQYRIAEEDRPSVYKLLDWDNVISHVDRDGFYTFNYKVQEDGVKHDLQGHCRKIDQHSFVCGFQNIDEMVAEEKARNKELREAKDAADVANQAKTAFLFNMSHDIRTPMNAIMGFRDLLEKHQDDPERRANYLEKIKDSSNVLLSIINNVLEMARIEKGTLEIEETAWNIEHFNDTLYVIFEDMMRMKGLTFTRQIDVLHHYVYCDSIKLREIFMNLLSNAYKYTNTGGTVRMTLSEIPSDRDGWVLFQTTVSDTGMGMSEEFLPHLFDEFSREHSSTETKIEGTGLGMPIVKRLVKMLGGTIEVKSKKGEGTTFIVTMPYRIATKDSLVESGGVEIDPKIFKGKRILLAEDNDLNTEIATEILGEAGFLIEHAADGIECCEMLSNAPADYYDVILMDIQMPHMNGYEAARAIHKMHDKAKSRIPIIAMTANAFEEDKCEAIRSGMNGHLVKPISVNDLMTQLATVLA